MALSKDSDLTRLSKVTAPALRRFKALRRPIVALTCYDYAMAQLLNRAGVDLLLVGDSLGMVKLGYRSTVPVTVEDMIYHTRIVARGNARALLVTDMPYLSYHAAVTEAVKNAGRMLKAGAEAVKIEGGREMLPVLRALRAAKIPVIGHLGLTPQSVHVFGGFKVQGRDRAARKNLLQDALALEKAGVSAIVLECVPKTLAKTISRRLRIPTIGIGAGVICDGQVLVLDDLLGLTPIPHPRFVKTYGDDVRRRRFPDDSQSYF
jgi:3-methyl-2-oxobutanoate hydroxymethyltransferase